MDEKTLDYMQTSVYLLAIDKYGSKKQASIELGVSIDTISKYISAMEEELKTTLLIQDGRGSILTRKALEIINVSKKIEMFVKKLNNIHSQKLSGPVVVTRTFAASDLASAIGFGGDFFEKYPNINIISKVINASQELDADVDVGVDFKIPDDNNFVIIHQQKLKYNVCAHKDYTNKYGIPKDLDDLLNNHAIIGLINAEKYLPHFKSVRSKAKNIKYEAVSALELREVLWRGVGVGLLPSMVVDSNIVVIDDLDIQTELTLYLFANKKTKDVSRVRVTIDYLKKALQSSYK